MERKAGSPRFRLTYVHAQDTTQSVGKEHGEHWSMAGKRHHLMMPFKLITCSDKSKFVCRSRAWNFHQIGLMYVHAQDTTQSSVSSCLVPAGMEISNLPRKSISIFSCRWRSPIFSPDTTLLPFKTTCPCALNHSPLQKNSLPSFN